MRLLLAPLCVVAMACQVPSCDRASAVDAAPPVASVQDAGAPIDAQARADCEAQCAQVPDVDMDAWDDLPPDERAEQQRNWLEGEKERLMRSPEYADCMARCAKR